ncbi:6-bladed beta-propeller [Candidatus Palauibacter sp.]|uniref:6-bladed beta-propeller n=1 Tax=Candidatus Palauibacter sp. TaxID=3101350 RepID=UPI003AF21A90
MEGEPDSDFSDIVGVIHGPDGSIAVADRLLARITVLSAGGTVLAAMGREGDGPGEFRSLSGIVVDGEGRLFTFDDMHQRLSEWTFDGTLVGDTRLSREATACWPAPATNRFFGSSTQPGQRSVSCASRSGWIVRRKTTDRSGSRSPSRRSRVCSGTRWVPSSAR